jgi:mitogen-activated protein kinase 15
VVAIKKIIDAFQNLIDAKRTYRELNYLLQIHHPCVVRLETILHLNSKGFSHEPSTTRIANPPSHQERGSNTDKLFSKTFPQQKHVYAVFEFIDTDLARALQICHELQPIQRKYIAYRLLHGIAFLHRSGLVHRDIKPSNILLNSQLEIKICDFGMARLKLANEPANEGVLTEYVASRWYRPPEALLGITTCDDSIDLWSVGCVIAELILKSPLFPGKSTLDQLELILKGIGMPSADTISKQASEQAQYVLRNFTFSKRCKFRALQDTLSQCSAEEMDLIINLLKFDPADRITAEEALRHEYFNEIKQLEGNLETYSKSYTVLRDDSTVNRLPQSE